MISEKEIVTKGISESDENTISDFDDVEYLKDILDIDQEFTADADTDDSSSEYEDALEENLEDFNDSHQYLRWNMI